MGKYNGRPCFLQKDRHVNTMKAHTNCELLRFVRCVRMYYDMCQCVSQYIQIYIHTKIDDAFMHIYMYIYKYVCLYLRIYENTSVQYTCAYTYI